MIRATKAYRVRKVKPEPQALMAKRETKATPAHRAPRATLANAARRGKPAHRVRRARLARAFS